MKKRSPKDVAAALRSRLLNLARDTVKNIGLTWFPTFSSLFIGSGSVWVHIRVGRGSLRSLLILQLSWLILSTSFSSIFGTLAK